MGFCIGANDYDAGKNVHDIFSIGRHYTAAILDWQRRLEVQHLALISAAFGEKNINFRRSQT